MSPLFDILTIYVFPIMSTLIFGIIIYDKKIANRRKQTQEDAV